MNFRLFAKHSKKDQAIIDFINVNFGYRPKELAQYRNSLTHKSASPDNNERLEYLGDAVLDSIVAHYLFDTFPKKDEGFLTRMRSKIVNRSSLNHLGLAIKIESVVKIRLEPQDHTDDIYGNALEAVVGAVYLDKGYKHTYQAITRLLEQYVQLETLESEVVDFKSALIEWAQKKKKEIRFDVTEDSGHKPHDMMFSAAVMIENQLLGRGTGSSKKKAEQQAAKQAFENKGLTQK